MQLKSGTIVQGGLIVPTKEKLIRKLFQSRLPRNFTKQDLDALLSQCGCVKGIGVRSSGIRFIHSTTGRILAFDEPQGSENDQQRIIEI